MRAYPPRRALVLTLLLLPFLVAATTQPAVKPKGKKQQFVRWVASPDGGGELQTAIAAYENDKGQRVYLVGAVHVGDRQYYRDLARTFQGYDALLYEMVKQKDAPAPKAGQRTGSLIGGMQLAMAEVLELSYQLDEIDYSRPNFVHADMDYDTFVERQEARGESFLTIFLRSYLVQLQRSAGGQANPELQMAQILDALASPDRGRKLKVVMGQQFADMEPLLEGLEGPDGSVIITERNRAAFKVLKEQLAAGKRNIGIFYGAGHLAGMARDLRKMGFKRTNVEWRTAWDVPGGGRANEQIRDERDGE